MSIIDIVRRLREKYGTPEGAEDTPEAAQEWDELERAVAGKPRDYRVGLTVKPVERGHRLYYEMCHVVDVLPSGAAGVVDPEGVLMIRASGGSVSLEPAGAWRTA